MRIESIPDMLIMAIGIVIMCYISIAVIDGYLKMERRKQR